MNDELISREWERIEAADLTAFRAAAAGKLNADELDAELARIGEWAQALELAADYLSVVLEWAEELELVA